MKAGGVSAARYLLHSLSLDEVINSKCLVRCWCGPMTQHGGAYINRVSGILFYTSVTTLVQSLLYWLEEAEFLLCHDGVHFITENRSFNFERPDRANP